jgi:4'-phosphopantetheinyl transferase
MNISGGEVWLFSFALDLPEARVAELERLISTDEADRAARFRQPRDRRRYVVHRAQTRTILAACVGERPEKLGFKYGQHGKPSLPARSGGPDVRFNMSRSSEVGLLALQRDFDVGVDIEHVRPYPVALDIAERFFAVEENTRLRALPRAEVDAAFFSYWTRKEAIVKAMGRGLTQPIDVFTLAPNPSPEGERVFGHWVVAVPPPAGGYVVAVASTGQSPKLRHVAWPDR